MNYRVRLHADGLPEIVRTGYAAGQHPAGDVFAELDDARFAIEVWTREHIAIVREHRNRLVRTRERDLPVERQPALSGAIPAPPPPLVPCRDEHENDPFYIPPELKGAGP